MDKHGWLKVLEAVIAITLLIGFLLYMMSTSAPKKDISRAVNEKEIYILNTISQNNSFRDDIINNNNANINVAIAKMTPTSWDFETRICPLDDICEGSTRPLDRDVYANEIVISSTDAEYGPKKLRLFIWAK